MVTKNFQIPIFFPYFASNDQQAGLRSKYLAGGMGWGYAKQELFEVMNITLSPIRDEYNRLIINKDYIDQVLKDGAKRASEIVSKKMDFIRKEIGLE